MAVQARAAKASKALCAMMIGVTTWSLALIYLCVHLMFSFVASVLEATVHTSNVLPLL